MQPEELAIVISQALGELVKNGSVDLSAQDIATPVKVERPKVRAHGDWATNIAMQLGKKAGISPRELAQLLAQELVNKPGIGSAEVAGPGFLNLRVEVASAAALVETILAAGFTYGHNTDLAGTHINLEYVSANPTGPVHLGGARWAAVGDALARVLMANGASVTREYYFNDHGIQSDRFAQSVLAAARGQEAPEEGYGGQYITDIANQVKEIARVRGDQDPATLSDKAAEQYYGSVGVDLMFTQIKAALHGFRTDFDVFFHEDSLHNSGAVQKAIDILRKRGVIADRDGAIWLQTTQFGDDKDRVLIKSDGQPAYFAADVAYYLDKKQRGSDCSIYLLGADHHGYVGRMMAMCAAYGDKPGQNMQILIGQMVNLFQNGEPVRMSKRAGNIVTLDDFVEIAGVDAARYSLVRSSMDTTLDIDLDVLRSKTNDNPVYYVQYAHARTCNVARNAAEHGVSRDQAFVPQRLDHPADGELLGALAQWPTVVGQAGANREPHRIARYLENLSATYHAWYNQCRVTPRGEEPVDSGHVARLYLNDAVTFVLANGLELLGVAAPQRM